MKNLNKLFLLIILASLTFAFYGCGDEDTVYGDWKQISYFGGAGLSDAAAFVIGNKGYVYAGYDGDDRLRALWEWNPEADKQWTQMATPPVEMIGRTAPVAFAIGTNGYVGLGYSGENLGFEGGDYLKDFYEINTLTNTWTKKADFAGSAREGAVNFALNGIGYVGCGYDKKCQMDFYKYDPSTDTWSDGPMMSEIGGTGGSKRYHATTFIYKDEAYVIGGINNLQTVTDFWKFNPTTQKWTMLNYIADKTDNSWDDDYGNMAREYPCVFVIDDKAYMTTGSNSSGSLLTDTWAYDFASDKWDDAPSFEGRSRTAALAFSINNRGIILTGRSGSFPFDDMWEYLPDQEYDLQTK